METMLSSPASRRAPGGGDCDFLGGTRGDPFNRRHFRTTNSPPLLLFFGGGGEVVDL
jgi:hypothetical protein